MLVIPKGNIWGNLGCSLGMPPLRRPNSSDATHTLVDGPPILFLLAVEEGIPLLLGHLEDDSGLGVDSPFLQPSADGLAGELGNAVCFRKAAFDMGFGRRLEITFLAASFGSRPNVRIRTMSRPCHSRAEWLSLTLAVSKRG